MHYTILCFKEGEDHSFNHFSNVFIVPQPGDIFSYSLSGGPAAERQPPIIERYEVLSRRFHMRPIGGSEPAGSEDYCLVTLILRSLEGVRSDDGELKDEGFLAPASVLQRFWYS